MDELADLLADFELPALEQEELDRAAIQARKDYIIDLADKKEEEDAGRTKDNNK